MDILNDFTIEEIMLIKNCNTRDKKSAIKTLKLYTDSEDSGMNETLHNTISKLHGVTEQEFIELLEYPDDPTNQPK